jgi:hypothetical protein
MTVADNNKLRPAVVLVAERTLSANYKALFEGMLATMQTTQVPQLAMRLLLSPPARVDSLGRAVTAPLGIRRVESALLASTPLTDRDVVCTTPEALGRLLGPWTKIVAVSSGDPLGGGMSNTTTQSFWKGQLYTKFWTAKLLQTIRTAKDKYHFHVVAGGAGAWQWAANQAQARSSGIDTICEGNFESDGPGLFMNILAGQSVPAHVSWPGTSCRQVQPIRGASTLGVIELSRGCGNGCVFCASGRGKMEFLPTETILADVRTNARLGQSSIVSSSEDFFRYGSVDGKVNFESLRSLLEAMRQIESLRFMQIDHGNISSVMQLSLEQLREIRRLLSWRCKSDYLWVNMGLESANGRLVQATGPGKLGAYNPDDWEDLARQASERMTRAGFFSVFSIILGLPGETPDDIARTLKLVRQLAQQQAVIFPIFYEPIMPGLGKPFTLADMRADHLELYRTCYENNFVRVPKLFWDNQRAAGVSFAKRALLQALGRGETRSWRRNFARIDKQLAAKAGRL